MNKAASDEIIWHCKHYTGRGATLVRLGLRCARCDEVLQQRRGLWRLWRCLGGRQELCKDMGIALSELETTHQEHFEAAKKQDG